MGEENAISLALPLDARIPGLAGTFRGGSPDAAVNGRVGFMLRSIHILTFGGGTNEMQRDLIALFGLGMPVQPRFEEQTSDNRQQTTDTESRSAWIFLL